MGTGPFRLVDWRRSSKIIFERNANFRDVRYDFQPNADDAEGQALLAKFKGRRLPLVDRVEISIIDEAAAALAVLPAEAAGPDVAAAQ